ncbi:O-methyltransferase [candidate division KSB1 bacterium]
MIRTATVILSLAFLWTLGDSSLITKTVSLAKEQPGSAWLNPDLDELLTGLENFNRRNRMLNVSREDGIFLKMLAELEQAKNILEIGASNGYSGIWFGLALKNTGGHLTTIDLSPEKVRMARENFEKAGLSDVITVLEGDAHEIIRKLDGPFDLVFIDAEKSGYLDYLKATLPKTKTGGIIAGHNAIDLASGMRDYLDLAQNHPNLETVIISTGNDGICVSRKIK